MLGEYRVKRARPDGMRSCPPGTRCSVADPVIAAAPAPPAAGVPLLRARLAPPALPDGLVERPRLRDLLAAGARGAVTLVAAPAGWGKTVLLSSWYRTADASVAWLSVEPGDTDADFWRYVAAALGAAAAGVPAPGEEPHEIFLARLADTLARRPAPLVLVLDDLHHLRGPLAGLDSLVRHTAGRLRLVIASRADPPLPLHRWRLSGDLTEIRADQLAFSLAEAAELLARQGLVLPADRLSDLHARAEGWPAGLRLAALAAGAATGGLGGEDAIAEYLTREVLAGQPPEIRDALCRTSVVERMSGDLVEALTGRSDGERLLADLARANLFVLPVDQWTYRYHGMLRDVLRRELRRREPGRLADLHRRAGRWHRERGAVIDGLRHALAAGDWRDAAEALTRHWARLVVTHRDASPAPPLSPPAEVVRADPLVALACAADRLDRGDLEGVRHWLRLAERHPRVAAGAGQVPLIAAALALPDAELSADIPRLRQTATDLLALAAHDARLPEGTHDDPAAGEAVHALALAALGAAHLATDPPATSEAALADALAAADRAELPCARLACASRLAVAWAVQGRLRSAERQARAALELVACPGRSHPVYRGHAHLALAFVHLERDRLPDAAAELDLAVGELDAAGPRDRCDPTLAALVAIARALLARAQGDLPGSYEALLAGRRTRGDQRPAGYLAHWLTAVEADLRVCHGEPDLARDLLAPLAAEASVPAATALARAHLAAGEPDAALRVLPEWASDERAGLSFRLDAGLLEALAARRLGDARRATLALESVLGLAEPEGFRLVFTRSGPSVREMLVEHLDSGTAFWFTVSDLCAAGRPQRQERLPPELGEPLTDREITVLRYLQSILSTGEIAAELCVSVNTVKTHVRNIYRKLAVSRRRDAVRRARELHIL